MDGLMVEAFQGMNNRWFRYDGAGHWLLVFDGPPEPFKRPIGSITPTEFYAVESSPERFGGLITSGDAGAIQQEWQRGANG